MIQIRKEPVPVYNGPGLSVSRTEERDKERVSVIVSKNAFSDAIQQIAREAPTSAGICEKLRNWFCPRPPIKEGFFYMQDGIKVQTLEIVRGEEKKNQEKGIYIEVIRPKHPSGQCARFFLKSIRPLAFISSMAMTANTTEMGRTFLRNTVAAVSQAATTVFSALKEKTVELYPQAVQVAQSVPPLATVLAMTWAVPAFLNACLAGKKLQALTIAGLGLAVGVVPYLTAQTGSRDASSAAPSSPFSAFSQGTCPAAPNSPFSAQGTCPAT